MSEEVDYIQLARQQRGTPAVLRLRVLQIWSSRPGSRIFIYEGVGDLGPYEVWINQISNSLEYVPLPANGKDQVLGFFESSASMQEAQSSLLYFFIDRDYDGMKGVEERKNIFVTNCYSAENYLCVNSVLRSLLSDEFRFAGRLEVIEQIESLFDRVAKQCQHALREASVRVYIGAKQSIRNGSIDDKITKYIDIQHDVVVAKTDADIEKLVPLERDITEDELREALEYFDSAESCICEIRGKFVLEFFTLWLERLEAALKQGTLAAVDGEPYQGKFHRNGLSMRNLACRALPPNGLEEFLAKNGMCA